MCLCHGPCSVTFFLKNKHRMALTEPPMMATSPLFSATLTISHPRRTYIRPPSDFIPYSDTNNKSAFLIIAITNQHHALFYRSTTRAPPCSTHIPCLRPIISCTHQFLRSWVSVAIRTCKDLSQHPSAPFGVRVFSLYVPFYNHILS